MRSMVRNCTHSLVTSVQLREHAASCVLHGRILQGRVLQVLRRELPGLAVPSCRRSIAAGEQEVVSSLASWCEG